MIVAGNCEVGLSVVGVADDGTIICGVSQSKTVSVECGPGATTPLQTALDNTVRSGDLVNVTGECLENILIRRSGITVQCTTDTTSITGVAGGSAITILGRNVTIQNCILRGDPQGRTVVSVLRSASATIQNNNISLGATNGINVSQSSYGRILNNEVHLNGTSGISISSASMADVHGNNIHDNGSSGLFIQRASSADITNNQIIDNATSGVLITRVAFGNFGDATFGNVANTIQGNNTRGVGCFDNSGVRFEVPQNFGTGNGPGGTANFVPEGNSFCANFGTP